MKESCLTDAFSDSNVFKEKCVNIIITRLICSGLILYPFHLLTFDLLSMF